MSPNYLQTDRYVAKYASKAESQEPTFPVILSNVVNDMEENGTALSACQKLLNKLIGERTYSAQETAHLLLGIPLVRSSTSFQTLYLASEGSMRPLEQADEGDVDREPGNADDGRPVTDESWLQRCVKDIVPHHLLT